MMRAFQDVLTDLDDGELHRRLTEVWPKVVQAARETNLAGALTIVLIAVPDRRGMISVTAKVSTKLPTPSVGATLFFADDEGTLTRHDPKQLPLRAQTLAPPREPAQPMPLRSVSPSHKEAI